MPTLVPMLFNLLVHVLSFSHLVVKRSWSPGCGLFRPATRVIYCIYLYLFLFLTKSPFASVRCLFLLLDTVALPSLHTLLHHPLGFLGELLFFPVCS